MYCIYIYVFYLPRTCCTQIYVNPLYSTLSLLVNLRSLSPISYLAPGYAPALPNPRRGINTTSATVRNKSNSVPSVEAKKSSDLRMKGNLVSSLFCKYNIKNGDFEILHYENSKLQ